MMRFSVRGTRYEFDNEKVTFGEARALEKVTGLTFDEVGKALDRGDVTALQAFMWIAMKREEPTMTFSDVDDIAIGEIEFHADPDDEQAEGDASEVPTDDGVTEVEAPAPTSTSVV